MKKQIGYIENLLIEECKKDEPNFGLVNRLFELGADPNAVNEYGETVLFEIFNSYCGEGKVLRQAIYAPQIVLVFMLNGFNVRKHALKTVSAMQNSIYDRNMRVAISILLDRRKELFKDDCKTVRVCLKAITNKVFKRQTA